jgi:outer membrane lipoprotein-sorting protein
MLTRSFLAACILFVLGSFPSAHAQAKTDDRAQAIISKAVQVMGGDRYLHVASQVGRGQYSVFQNNAVVTFQRFIDVIVFPDKERTEFRGGGSKTVQTNTGKTGWVYDGDQELIKVQTEKQVGNFVTGLRVSLDNLLRGYWKGEAELSYVGRRQATLGKRNDVVRLTYKDGTAIEFEFSDDGTPAKSVYKHTNADGAEVTEEDRYAQFIDVDGIKAPFIVDRFTNGSQNSRINYDSIEFNKSIPDSVFAKPSSPKELKKDLKI